MQQFSVSLDYMNDKAGKLALFIVSKKSFQLEFAILEIECTFVCILMSMSTRQGEIHV